MLELEEPATPEEEAAAKRIAEFQGEIDAIKQVMNDQGVVVSTEQDDSI